MVRSGENKHSTHDLFVPPFAPPSINKDWERSFYTPLFPNTHFPEKENAHLLSSLHFFFTPSEKAAHLDIEQGKYEPRKLL